MKFVDELLDQAHQYLSEIKTLSDMQLRFLKSGELEELPGVLERKDLALKRLSKIYSSIRSSQDELSGNIHTITDNTFEKIADLTNTVKKILHDDHSSLHKAMENKNKAYNMLQEIVQGRKLIRKYRQKGLSNKHSKQWNG